VDLQVDVKRIIGNGDGQFKNGIVCFISATTWSKADDERCTCYGDCFPLVNLSRSGANPECWVRLDLLSQHNHHAPTFHQESDMEEYIQRVTDAVTAAVESWEAAPCTALQAMVNFPANGSVAMLVVEEDNDAV
jgi:hypothetical protein